MTKMSGPVKQSESRASSGVTCAKCEHVNPHGRSVCENCGAHLHVVCHSCGHRNPRSRTHCSECGHKLHRRWYKRLLRRVFGTDKKAAQGVLLIITVLLSGMALLVYAYWQKICLWFSTY